jgi:GMP synthase (glutamine-hydrolysing)
LNVLIIDNGSPYVKDLDLCLDQIGQSHTIKRFDEDFSLSSYEKVILSGRQKNKKQINAVNSKISKICFNDEIPLLGICYGAEIVALTFGGSIQKSYYVQGLNRISIEKPIKLLKEAYYNVYESHSYVISHLPEDFVGIASSASSKYEILCHSSKKIFGTQFHPEKSGDCGIELIRNFVNL